MQRAQKPGGIKSHNWQLSLP